MRQYFIFLALVLCLPLAMMAQKGKIKEGATATESVDTAQAKQNKAAIRGGQLMEASRDSLRAGGLQAPTDIVDTFGIEAAADRPRTYLGLHEIIEAQDRIDESKQQLIDAGNQLDIARTGTKYSEKELEKAQKKLDKRMADLEEIEKQLAVLIHDWEETTGQLVPKSKLAAAAAEGSK